MHRAGLGSGQDFCSRNCGPLQSGTAPRPKWVSLPAGPVLFLGLLLKAGNGCSARGSASILRPVRDHPASKLSPEQGYEDGQSNNGDTVKVHYTDTLEEGSIFDTSADHEPLKFIIGEGQVLPGFERAVIGMSPGEPKTTTIAAEHATVPATWKWFKWWRAPVPAPA